MATVKSIKKTSTARGTFPPTQLPRATFILYPQKENTVIEKLTPVSDFSTDNLLTTPKKSRKFLARQQKLRQKCWWRTLQALYNITNSTEYKQKAKYSRLKLAS